LELRLYSRCKFGNIISLYSLYRVTIMNKLKLQLVKEKRILKDLEVRKENWLRKRLVQNEIYDWLIDKIKEQQDKIGKLEQEYSNKKEQ